MSVTLRDGTFVSTEHFTAIQPFLERLSKGDPFVLAELIEKCKNPNYVFFQNADTERILKATPILDKNGNVPEAFQKIVLNSFEEKDFIIRFVNASLN